MRPLNQIPAICLTLLSLTATRTGLAQLPAVPTARQPVTNTYHGVPIIEDYQWLEESTNVAVRDWTRQQNERTRAYFDKLPFYEGLSQALEELIAE
jgi:prolyl oligopeptidase